MARPRFALVQPVAERAPDRCHRDSGENPGGEPVHVRHSNCDGDGDDRLGGEDGARRARSMAVTLLSSECSKTG